MCSHSISTIPSSLSFLFLTGLALNHIWWYHIMYRSVQHICCQICTRWALKIRETVFSTWWRPPGRSLLFMLGIGSCARSRKCGITSAKGNCHARRKMTTPSLFLSSFHPGRPVGPCCTNTWGGNAVDIGYYDTIKKHHNFFFIICNIELRKIPIVPDSSRSIQNWYMKYLITTVIQAEDHRQRSNGAAILLFLAFPNCVPSSTKFTLRWP